MRNRNSSSNGVEQNRRDVPWRLCSHASARRLFLTILFNAVFASCKNGTPVTATQVVLDSADQGLLGMSHYVTQLGVLRARRTPSSVTQWLMPSRTWSALSSTTWVAVTGVPFLQEAKTALNRIVKKRRRAEA